MYICILMINPPLPDAFLNAIAGAPGLVMNDFIAAHQHPDIITSIRINPFKSVNIDSKGIVPWCREGVYLKRRPSFTFDPLFHAGCFYVQEASSMFIGHIYNSIKPYLPAAATVLDLCAAPGGKSTLLASALQADDLLVANEIIKTRVPLLTDNLTRWGMSNIVASNNDPKDFGRLPGFFDVMLVDAPCSGSGMFRKDPDAIGEWSEANVNLCQQRQERILADAYPALKQDGYLIYSTCSYSEQENEQVLDWLCNELELESVRIPVETAWGIVETQSVQHKAWGYRLYPGQVQGEGLFAACLKKTQRSGEAKGYKSKQMQKLSPKEIEPVKSYLKEPHSFYYFKLTEDWLAIPQQHKEALQLLQQHLYLKKSGIRLGKLAGKELIPDHELALSIDLNKDVFLQTELTLDQAIEYLRKDNISNLTPQQKGWSLMTYQQQALGWAKLLPNRINNYYPKEIRILASVKPTNKDTGL
jgi:16S rRNA C967 or C1407 C5-methylase (RsmB/RsmF family)/NOL1/NOP2/fmu family ribosome biogenesis protein